MKQQREIEREKKMSDDDETTELVDSFCVDEANFTVFVTDFRNVTRNSLCESS